MKMTTTSWILILERSSLECIDLIVAEYTARINLILCPNDRTAAKASVEARKTTRADVGKVTRSVPGPRVSSICDAVSHFEPRFRIRPLSLTTE